MIAVLIPVGPAPDEPDRLIDTLHSVRGFVPSDQIHLIVIDDGHQARSLPVTEAAWGSVDIIRTPSSIRDMDPYSAMVAGTLTGLRAAAARDPEFVLKLDTDALVIGPVLPALQAAFADSRLGLVGSYTHTCTGGRRDWRGWVPVLRRAGAMLSVAPGPRLSYRRARCRRWVRRRLDEARANGYDLGAHCLGGAYAVGPGLLARTDLLEWWPWTGTGLSEDVVVGVLASAAGLSIRGLVGPGEPFALAWQGLPRPPAELIANGHSIVHSVKNQPLGDERSIRAFFRSARAASPELSHVRSD